MCNANSHLCYWLCRHFSFSLTSKNVEASSDRAYFLQVNQFDWFKHPQCIESEASLVSGGTSLSVPEEQRWMAISCFSHTYMTEYYENYDSLHRSWKNKIHSTTVQTPLYRSLWLFTSNKVKCFQIMRMKLQNQRGVACNCSISTQHQALSSALTSLYTQIVSVSFISLPLSAIL